LGGPERIVAEIARTGGTSSSRAPAWSIDGKSLVVFDRPMSQAGGLWLISVDSGDRRRLPTVPENIGDVSPMFAPDGQSLLFARGRGTIHDLYLLNLDKSLTPLGEPPPMTQAHEALWNAAWSPNGRELIFALGAAGQYILHRLAISGDNNPKPFVGSPSDVR